MAEKNEIIRVLTPNFRVSFPNVFRAKAAFDGQEPKFSVQMLFPKEADLKPLKAALAQACKKKWGDKIPKDLRKPFRDGDEKGKFDGYAGTTFCNASSKQRPGLVDQRLQDITVEEDFYAGCWARAKVTVYAYDTMGNRGVAFGLQNLQKIKDDKPFSGKVNAKDDFDAVESFDGDDDEDVNVEDF